MPTIDELAPKYVRAKRIGLSLDPSVKLARANEPILLLVDYAKTLPDDVMLPLILEVQAPHASGYQKRTFGRHKPETIIFTPHEGGRHNVTLREAAHNRWWGSLAIEVAGEPL